MAPIEFFEILSGKAIENGVTSTCWAAVAAPLPEPADGAVDAGGDWGVSVCV